MFISMFKEKYPDLVKPLAAYIFTTDKYKKKTFLNEITAGSVCVN